MLSLPQCFTIKLPRIIDIKAGYGFAFELCPSSSRISALTRSSFQPISWYLSKISYRTGNDVRHIPICSSTEVKCWFAFRTRSGMVKGCKLCSVYVDLTWWILYTGLGHSPLLELPWHIPMICNSSSISLLLYGSRRMNRLSDRKTYPGIILHHATNPVSVIRRRGGGHGLKENQI